MENQPEYSEILEAYETALAKAKKKKKKAEVDAPPITIAAPRG